MTVSIRDTRAHIYELQYYLRSIRIAKGLTPMLNPDGIFGEETKMAVEEFQSQNNLPITGRVDGETWQRIFEAYKEAEELLSPAESVRVFPLEIKEMKLGDEYDEVYVLQILLRKNREYVNGDFNVLPNGIYDEATEEAVRKFQSLFGIEQTGAADKKFWNKFAKYSNTKYLTEKY